MPAYRLPSPHDRTPLQRRVSGFALALAINLVLLFVLMGLGVIPPPEEKTVHGVIIDLLPQSRSASQTTKTQAHRQHIETNKPVPKLPPIILPSRPTIAPPPRPSKKSQPWIEMSKDEMAASDISKLPAAGSGGAGDSEVAGRGPNGETLYAVDWVREPTNAELGGYLPPNAPDGWGEIACKTIPGNRVDDCIEVGQSPRGSHLASAVRQAAWQFHIKPPRKNGRAMIGEWILVHIDYGSSRSVSASGD